MTSPSNEVVPPPSHIQQEELTESELARLRAPAKRPFFRIRSRRRQPKNSDPHTQNTSQQTGLAEQDGGHPGPSEEPEDTPFIKVGNSVTYADEFMENYDKDVYRWAVLYENQRGATLFSAPYYSRLSLLPVDPPAFTLPTTSKLSRNTQPSFDLSTYPLPDGSWRWISREWMVDMRGDGQTQYDGFEYNGHFRTKHWRSQVGFFSAGGWVRRRRWVRLMMRPAIARHTSGAVSEAGSPLLGGSTPRVEGATRPPSVTVTSGDSDYDSNLGESDLTLVWKGVVEDDWQRCRRALKRLDRDGRKLEIWHRWLRQLLPSDETCVFQTLPGAISLPRKQWTEDDDDLPSQHIHDTTGVVDEHLVRDAGVSTDPAAREHIVGVLRAHCQEILRLFIYPESRTQFLELLACAKLLPELDLQLGCSASSMLDFWSSSQSLQNLVVSDSST